MRDDDAGRMGRRIARHALNFQRRIDQLVHRFVFCTGTAQLRRLFQCVSERNVKIARDQLGHGVYRRIRHAHGAPHVAHGGTRRQCTERNDLGDMVFAVLFGHIVDHFAAALIAKVDVKIRHADTFGIQKALKDQAVLHRVQVGDLHAVRRKRPGAAAAPGADRNAFAFGKAHKIGHDQIIIRVAHLLDRFQFIAKAFLVRLRHRGAVALFEAAQAAVFKIFKMVAVAGRFKIRQLGLAEFKVKTAAFGDLCRVFQRLGHVGKRLLHFGFTLQVKCV